MGNKCMFREAVVEDIPQMVEIEKQFFDNKIAFDCRVLEEWLEYNSKMFYVVVNEDNKVLGFTILMPISVGLYNDLKLGKVHDMIDFKKEDVYTELQSEYYYVADIATDSKKLKISLVLLRGMIQFLCNNAHFVLATPVTKEGLNLCKSVGFKTSDGDENNLGKNCEIEITDSLIAKYFKR